MLVKLAELFLHCWAIIAYEIHTLNCTECAKVALGLEGKLCERGQELRSILDDGKTRAV